MKQITIGLIILLFSMLQVDKVVVRQQVGQSPQGLSLRSPDG